MPRVDLDAPEHAICSRALELAVGEAMITVRIKVGEAEMEASGSHSFVDVHVRSFMRHILKEPRRPTRSRLQRPLRARPMWRRPTSRLGEVSDG
ncbi:MAG TPA: hypothetical protein VNJ04_05065 [Gemmatimonadaceae bacterium]|nr:hypothetical protein [Gemmatimonadaceae bacterium]